MIRIIKHHSPGNLQAVGFMVLLPLFLITGLLLINLPGDKVTWPTAMVYVVAQVFFEVGPNFTTFILPAEISLHVTDRLFMGLQLAPES